VAHVVREDQAGVTAVLEKTGERISFLLQAMCVLLRSIMADRWFDPETAPDEWAKMAAMLATGMRDGGDSNAE
jgi:hypothetical protein